MYDLMPGETQDHEYDSSMHEAGTLNFITRISTAYPPNNIGGIMGPGHGG